MDLAVVVAVAVVAAVAYGVHWLLTPILRTLNVASPFKLHATYQTETGEERRFPTLFEQGEPEVRLSVIVPAYNEQDRLPAMLNETMRYLDQRHQHDPEQTFEIIVVDDGSKDATRQVAQSYVKANGSDIIRVLALSPNAGKGAAIQAGMLHARGAYLLMVDADGASRFSDIKQLENALKRIEQNGHGVAIGSRAHLAEQAIAKRHWFRNFLMRAFHVIVAAVACVNIRDTQCGFKLFTRASARDLFANLHLMRWAFDVELIFMAGRLGIPMAEVSIHWTEVPGSKLSLIDGAVTMFRDIVAIRVCYLTGLWQIHPWQDVFRVATREHSRQR